MKTIFLTLVLSFSIAHLATGKNEQWTTRFSGVADSIPAQDSTVKVTIYPNPARSRITIDFQNEENEEKEIEYSIGDVLGKKKKSEKRRLKNGEVLTLSIDLTDYPPGVYFIYIKQGGQYNIYKFVVSGF